MQMNLREVLKMHYGLNDRWWVSDKQILNDLLEWDSQMHGLLLSFLKSGFVKERYGFWQQMIDHILKPVGGRKHGQIETDCGCEKCQADVAKLKSLFIE